MVCCHPPQPIIRVMSSRLHLLGAPTFKTAAKYCRNAPSHLQQREVRSATSIVQHQSPLEFCSLASNKLQRYALFAKSNTKAHNRNSKSMSKLSKYGEAQKNDDENESSHRPGTSRLVLIIGAGKHSTVDCQLLCFSGWRR